MTDEFDRLDAADGDGRGGDSGGGRHGKTAVATRPGERPLRPSGKRARNRVAAGAGTAAGTSDGEARGGDGVDGAKARKAKKTREGPARNPFFPVVFVVDYLKRVVAELRKVIWPNRKQMITYTTVVLAFLVVMVALVAGADYGFAKLVLLVFGE